MDLSTVMGGRAAARPAAGPAVTRTVTDFVVAFLDRIAVGGGPWASLREAAAVVQGPGAGHLLPAIDSGGYTEWEQIRERLSDLAAAWSTPVLESLAVALRGGAGPGKPMQQYLLACAQAEACAALTPSSA